MPEHLNQLNKLGTHLDGLVDLEGDVALDGLDEVGRPTCTTCLLTTRAALLLLLLQHVVVVIVVIARQMFGHLDDEAHSVWAMSLVPKKVLVAWVTLTLGRRCLRAPLFSTIIEWFIR